MSVVEDLMQTLYAMADRGYYPPVYYLRPEDFKLMDIHMDRRGGKTFFRKVEIREWQAAPPLKIPASSWR